MTSDCPLSSALPQGGQPRTTRAPPLRSTSRIATRRLWKVPAALACDEPHEHALWATLEGCAGHRLL